MSYMETDVLVIEFLCLVFVFVLVKDLSLMKAIAVVSVMLCVV